MSQAKSTSFLTKRPQRSTQSFANKLDKQNANLQQTGLREPKYLKSTSRAKQGFIKEPGHAGYKYGNAIYCPNDSVKGIASFKSKEWRHYDRPLTSRVESFNTQSNTGACFLISKAIEKHVKELDKQGVSPDKIHKSIVDITLEELLKIKK